MTTSIREIGTVFFFGDSNLARIACRESWVDKVMRYINTNGGKGKFCGDDLELDSYNLGISGSRSDIVLRVLGDEISNRQKNDKNTMIVSVGSNDSYWVKKNMKWYCSPDQYISNMDAIINSFLKFSNSIHVLNIPPVREDKINDLAILFGWQKNNDNINKVYNNPLAKLIQKYNDRGVHLIDVNNFISRIDDKEFEIFAEDGIHFTDFTHEIFHYKVLEHLIKTGGIDDDGSIYKYRTNSTIEDLEAVKIGLDYNGQLDQENLTMLEKTIMMLKSLELTTQ